MNRYALAVFRRINLAYEYCMSLLPDPMGDRRQFLMNEIISRGVTQSVAFTDNGFCSRVESFVDSMHVDGFEYRYAPSINEPTLYSSVYACLIYAMTGRLSRLGDQEKTAWRRFFDDHQSAVDGLFYDDSATTAAYRDSDWWGARHLMLHMIPAYEVLGGIPRHEFHFLEPYKDRTYLQSWLDGQDWASKFTDRNDIDNKIMNIAGALQYKRDVFGDAEAGTAIQFIQRYLGERRSLDTGMWGGFDLNNARERSRAVQFAYHLFSMFIFDEIDLADVCKVCDTALGMQNQFGGFGEKENSSACEDIDALDVLIRLKQITDYRAEDVLMALKRSFVWLLSNQNDDGGFVFRRNQSMVYGHPLLASGVNESAMFPTWFRTLSVAMVRKALGAGEDFSLVRCPGYYPHKFGNG